MRRLIDKLESTHRLEVNEYKQLLTCTDVQELATLYERARRVTLDNFGNRIFLRGLIEITNRCRNNCYYCGIRAGNKDLQRYSLTRDEVLACCRQGWELGFRTFVLQGGELSAKADEWLMELVASIRANYPSCIITLSVGEKDFHTYRLFRQAGANRYLLRHETRHIGHYQMLHPQEMSLEHRLECLHWLREAGFEVGTGIMVGSPYQTVEHLIEDIRFITDFAPEMIGIGPFIPHADTPLGHYPAGSLEMTLKLLSVFRLIFPKVLMPATTALASLVPDGRNRGILAGANVVMPNLSPPEERKKYSLYNHKACQGSEAAEGLMLLQDELALIGYQARLGCAGI